VILRIARNEAVQESLKLAGMNGTEQCVRPFFFCHGVNLNGPQIADEAQQADTQTQLEVLHVLSIALSQLLVK
jgi:hypothetical protein